MGIGQFSAVLAAISISSLSVFSTPVSAAGESCEALFTSVDIAQSEAIRTALKTDILSIRTGLRAQRMNLQIEIENVVSAARDQGLQDIVKERKKLAEYGVGHTLVKDVMPPPISAATREGLRDIYTENEYHKALFEKEDTDAKRARHLVTTDPYFNWLQKYSSSQRNPIEVFLEVANAYLPYDLALLRVQQEFDPSLPLKAVQLIDRALEYYRMEMTVTDEILPLVKTREQNFGAATTWSSIRGLPEARADLRKILDEQVALYGHLFPRKTYTAIRNLLNDSQSKKTVFVARTVQTFRRDRITAEKVYLQNGTTPAEAHRLALLSAVKTNRVQLEEVRKDLGFPDDFPLEFISPAILSTVEYNHVHAYEKILIEMYGNNADGKGKTTMMVDKIEHLNQYVMVAQAFETPHGAMAYIRHILSQTRDRFNF